MTSPINKFLHFTQATRLLKILVMHTLLVFLLMCAGVREMEREKTPGMMVNLHRVLRDGAAPSLLWFCLSQLPVEVTLWQNLAVLSCQIAQLPKVAWFLEKRNQVLKKNLKKVVTKTSWNSNADDWLENFTPERLTWASQLFVTVLLTQNETLMCALEKKNSAKYWFVQVSRDICSCGLATVRPSVVALASHVCVLLTLDSRQQNFS